MSLTWCRGKINTCVSQYSVFKLREIIIIRHTRLNRLIKSCLYVTKLLSFVLPLVTHLVYAFAYSFIFLGVHRRRFLVSRRFKSFKLVHKINVFICMANKYNQISLGLNNKGVPDIGKIIVNGDNSLNLYIMRGAREILIIILLSFLTLNLICVYKQALLIILLLYITPTLYVLSSFSFI